MRSFDELVDEAAAVPVEGWDFSWLDGRATEQRPSWGYQRLLGGKLATEGWPPNLAKATARLHPLGAVVVADDEEPPLPFADGAFDLVTSRHPATVHWSEIARVLTPGGTYFAQHVGGGTNVEISEYFSGPLDPGERRHHAMVFFLRKVVWTVPDFTVDRYRDRLKELHDQIDKDRVFRSTMSRTLLEARKPTPNSS